MKIAVGPSAPPIIPIEAASWKLKPRHNAPKKAANIPNWAAAPNNRLLGFAIKGPKSVNTPTPIKISGGNIPNSSPWKIYQSKPPFEVSVGSFIIPAPGKLAKSIPKAIGKSSNGSYFFTIAK